jgi:hypothetical protein
MADAARVTMKEDIEKVRLDLALSVTNTKWVRSMG